MAMKSKTTFVCLNCQNTFSRWAGRCTICGEWNTLVEQTESAETTSIEPAQVTKLSQVNTKHLKRTQGQLKEFDRVLGGDEPGFVAGSVILLAGSPGVGKSTLLLQVASHVDGALYVSAEESLEQLRLRSDRLGLTEKDFFVCAEREIGKIIAAVKAQSPKLVIIDSIQTIYDEAAAGTPGSIVQIREIVWRLQRFAKANATTFVVVGHITKEGLIAGPKVLEHLVDVVLYLEGEKQTGLRLLRAEKNRFGPLDEVGIWQMARSGFVDVSDPGKLFANLVGQSVPGRALSVTSEGSRSFLVEVQALSAKTSYGYPKRTSQGIDPNRLNVILAVLENRLQLPVSSFDIFINVVGGFTIKDPGIDLAIAAAIISSVKGKALPENMAFSGEIGLLGEVRPTFDHARRVKEAARLSYKIPSDLTLAKLKGLVS